MILNFHNSTRAYTAMMLQMFGNMQIKIDDSKLYNIPVLYEAPSRLYQKLAKPDKSFTYRVPIMSIEMNIDAQSSIGRLTNPILRRKIVELENYKLGITYNDKPCDFLCTLTVISDTLSSLTNIVEGINAMFYHNTLYGTYKTPLGDEIRTPIKLEDIGLNIDRNDDVPEADRYLEATFMFRIEGVVHSNFNTTSSKITEVGLIIKDYNLDIETELAKYMIKED